MGVNRMVADYTHHGSYGFMILPSGCVLILQSRVSLQLFVRAFSVRLKMSQGLGPIQQADLEVAYGLQRPQRRHMGP